MKGFLNRFLTDFRFVEDKNTLKQYAKDRANLPSASLKQGLIRSAIGLVSLILFSVFIMMFKSLEPTGTIRTIFFLFMFILGIGCITLFLGLYNIIIALLFKNKNYKYK